ncbi:MAG: EAL domain-containing protein [Rhodospirillales bacterium]|nr:EAL domain-containing protein [Rhodospirillales bacterium]
MAQTGTVMTFPGSESTSEETQLITRLRFIEDDRAGHYVVHVHLSGLRSPNRKPHFISIAARSFDDLLNNFDVTLYKLDNADLVLLCKDVPVEEIDPAMHKVRQLFSEDPLTASEDGSIDDRFSTWYDLVQQGDFASFVENINLLSEQAIERQRKASGMLSANSLPGEDMRPGDIAEIILRLQTVEIEDLIYSQTAVVIHPEAKGKALFREQFVSMTELQKRIAPDVNLFGSNWLFQYLTETIDRRLLGVMGQRDFETLVDPISLNLNISTVLGREFQRFHQHAGAYSAEVIIELQLVDVFADMAAFADARDMLQENGYRVLIDGLNPLSLQFFDPALLEADLIKVNWGQEFKNENSDARVDDMAQVVKNVGKDNVILGRVDSEDAVVWALALGITRFQGYYIDTLVEAMAAKGII